MTFPKELVGYMGGGLTGLVLSQVIGDYDVTTITKLPADVVDAVVESLVRNAPIIIGGTVLTVGGAYYLYRYINDIAEKESSPLIQIKVGG